MKSFFTFDDPEQPGLCRLSDDGSRAVFFSSGQQQDLCRKWPYIDDAADQSSAVTTGWFFTDAGSSLVNDHGIEQTGWRPSHTCAMTPS